MKCPTCSKEMVVGKIQGDREVMWVEENMKPLRISSKLFFNSQANVERCNECNIVVVV